jgi:hypothetical protein
VTLDTIQIGEATASPTKQFFVNMLTRDIELQDAVLDLLDNCVDGILRSAKPDAANPQPYVGFQANITMAKDHFVISDNCGGIPIETARKYAFAMGRPVGAEAENSPATVGMYGIGMKRAIFKLGTDALVESWNDTGFAVEITPKWMSDEGWDNLPMYELPEGSVEQGHTTVTVMTLNPEVSSAFGNGTWVDDFRKIVSQHYSIIIDKGFSVLIGDGTAGPIKVNAEPFKLLQVEDRSQNGIAPYVYAGKIDGVEIEIYAGLYRQLLTADESEREEETRGVTDDAGWTVACNDRVVIWKDKTRLTGWGEATVPNYHGQFIAITGIVLMRSDNPKLLPLTTTKRGIDAASNVYSEAKDFMREATKSLTSFTNQWKKFPEKLDSLYRQTEYVDLPTLRTLPASVKMTALRKKPEMAKHVPVYPAPAEERTHAVVKFEAPKDDIRLLAKQFFGEDQKVKPGDVGREAFNRCVKSARDKA